jgi:surfeit locus 1 family protein
VSPVLALLKSRGAWGIHLVTVLAVLAAGWLGLWQLGAWQAHREAAQQDLTHETPIPLGRALGPDDPLTGDHLGQPVTLEGRWLPQEVVVQRSLGYWDVAFLETDSGSAMPVVLGWHSTTGAPSVPSGPAGGVTGWLQPSQETDPGGATPPDGVLPALRIADLAQRVDVDLYGAYVVADHSAVPGQEWGELRQAHLDQQPSAGSWAGLRNLFYAVEWWFFAGFAIFLWGKWVRDETREQIATEDAVPSNV